MSQTKLETLINHLLDLFPDGGKIAGFPVQVIDGPGALDIRNDVLFIGASVFTSSYSGAVSQEWAGVGRIPPTRKESLELNCALRVGVGNKNMRACRTRAIAIFEGVAEALRSDADAFSASGQFQQIQLARYRLYQERSTDGMSVTIEFTITAMARV